MTETEKQQDWTLVWLIKEAIRKNGAPTEAEKLLRAALNLIYARLHFKPVEKSAINRKEQSGDPYRTTVSLSPNHGGKIQPQFIVLHASYGSFAGSKSWILKSESQVSYHYLINGNGDRAQFVPSDVLAWHAGSSEWKGITGLNSCSIGVSFFGPSDRDPSEEEIDSCARLCIQLQQKYQIPSSNILTHKMIAPDRKDDCSDKTLARVKERIFELAEIRAGFLKSSHETS